ncbi:MAG: hypothetical protein AAFR17_04140 [Pseudomonadota bacterium]
MQRHFIKTAWGLGALTLLAACGSTDQTRDQSLDSHPLEAMTASVWVAGDGCKHWVIDNGVEGYLTPVLNRDGTPDCS